jgi:hypothetical protein
MMLTYGWLCLIAGALIFVEGLVFKNRYVIIFGGALIFLPFTFYILTNQPPVVLHCIPAAGTGMTCSTIIGR